MKRICECQNVKAALGRRNSREKVVKEIEMKTLFCFCGISLTFIYTFSFRLLLFALRSFSKKNEQKKSVEQDIKLAIEIFCSK